MPIFVDNTANSIKVGQEPSAWERVSQGLHIEEKLSGNTADMKLTRVAYVAGKGVYEGATQRVADIIEHPAKAIPGLIIGSAAEALMCSGRWGGNSTRVIRPISTATAAIDLIPRAAEIGSGLQSAWSSNGNLDRDAANFGSLWMFLQKLRQKHRRILGKIVSLAIEIPNQWIIMLLIEVCFIAQPRHENLNQFRSE